MFVYVPRMSNFFSPLILTSFITEFFGRKPLGALSNFLCFVTCLLQRKYNDKSSHQDEVLPFRTAGSWAAIDLLKAKAIIVVRLISRDSTSSNTTVQIIWYCSCFTEEHIIVRPCKKEYVSHTVITLFVYKEVRLIWNLFIVLYKLIHFYSIPKVENAYNLYVVIKFNS